MSKGVNKVILVGNATKDADARFMPNGTAVTNFTIATSEQWKDSSGQHQERTEFNRCVAFGKLAEIVGQYLKKGGKVYAEGKLVTRKWEKDGQTHYTTEIHVSEFQMLDGRREASGDDHGFDQSAARTPPRQQAPAADFEDIPF